MRVYLLKILTPEKRIYESQVVSVTVTGANGRLTVLAGHAPMVAMLTEGPIIIRTEQETEAEILPGEDASQKICCFCYNEREYCFNIGIKRMGGHY